MNITDFIEKLEVEFEEVEKGSITPNTVFLDMKEWCSLYALIVMAIVSTDYDVDLSGDDLVGVATVSDLFDLIQRRKAI
ncbi:MAG: hypothetical protein P1U78_09115 [Alcanivoracaceae bacterium]|nr:hypothetical protein [Alcanivoracaceae bacterium]